MATTHIRLENGIFSGKDFADPTHVQSNGWDCVIDKNGTVTCNAVREYSDGEHSVRYVIMRNGFAKLTRKLPGKPVETLKKGFILRRGQKLSSGMIGLSGGHIDSRYAYFRDSAFQEFLERFDLTAMSSLDPNQEYLLRSAEYGGGICKSELLTDGGVSKLNSDFGRSEKWAEENPGTCASECNSTYQVTGATWVIVSQTQHEGDHHNHSRILITKEKDLKMIEKMLMANETIATRVKKKEMVDRLYAFNGIEVRCSDDVKTIIAQIIEIAPKITSDFDEEAVEAFMKEFDLTGGYRFMIENQWRYPDYNGKEFFVMIACTNGLYVKGAMLRVASGLLA